MSTSTQERVPDSVRAAVDLREIAVDALRLAMQQGASAAEVVATDGSEFSTTVRLGEVETLKEAGSKAVGSESSSAKAPPALIPAT